MCLSNVGCTVGKKQMWCNSVGLVRLVAPLLFFERWLFLSFVRPLIYALSLVRVTANGSRVCEGAEKKALTFNYAPTLAKPFFCLLTYKF